jgi:hypothetical protein
MKIPTPLNGWRAFAGEVGVIVLGVLLALGAQQLAEAVQMRANVREFRRTIDHEIGLNLYVYEIRSRGSACNEKRIRTLIDWAEKAGDGQVLPKITGAAPIAITPYRSAWDTRNGEVFAHVPDRARQKYAEFYDELENNWDLMKLERDELFALQRYVLPGPVSLDDRRALYGHLRRALILNRVWAPNMEISRDIADQLAVKPIRPDNVSAELIGQVAVCQPAFAPVDGAAGLTAKS